MCMCCVCLSASGAVRACAAENERLKIKWIRRNMRREKNQNWRENRDSDELHRRKTINKQKRRRQRRQ